MKSQNKEKMYQNMPRHQKRLEMNKEFKKIQKVKEQVKLILKAKDLII